jgi:hypothetical protein
MSLTKKFVLTFLLVTLLPLGLIIWVSHQTLVDQAQQQIGARLEDGVAQVGKSIDAYMLNCISNISTLAANPDLGLGDYKLIGEHLSRAAFSKSCFEQVMFVDTQGGRSDFQRERNRDARAVALSDRRQRHRCFI